MRIEEKNKLLVAGFLSNVLKKSKKYDNVLFKDLQLKHHALSRIINKTISSKLDVVLDIKNTKNPKYSTGKMYFKNTLRSFLWVKVLMSYLQKNDFKNFEYKILEDIEISKTCEVSVPVEFIEEVRTSDGLHPFYIYKVELPKERHPCQDFPYFSHSQRTELTYPKNFSGKILNTYAVSSFSKSNLSDYSFSHFLIASSLNFNIKEVKIKSFEKEEKKYIEEVIDSESNSLSYLVLVKKVLIFLFLDYLLLMKMILFALIL